MHVAHTVDLRVDTHADVAVGGRPALEQCTVDCAGSGRGCVWTYSLSIYPG